MAAMGHNEMLNDWARIQEMFGELAHPEHLAEVALQGAELEGRGAVVMNIALGKPMVRYKAKDYFNEAIDPGEFREGLFEAIDDYDPRTQAIIVVSFDEVYQNPSLSYQWFGIDLIFPEAG